MKKWRIRLPIQAFIGIALGFAVAIGSFIYLHGAEQRRNKIEVNMITTLEKIVNVSELSTFTAVYNGVAQVMNDKKPEETDYYVSYEARVNAGIDFKQLTISVNHKEKTVLIQLPEIRVIDIDVNASSLDYIFRNNKANTAAITAVAIKACEADVQQESTQQESILKLARQNAENVLKALTKPIIEQLDLNYRVAIE